jgi:putative selenium metabolism hydrolase
MTPRDPVAFCQELVRIPSLSGAEGDVMRLVGQRMADLGYDEVRHDRSGNTVGILRGRRPGPRLLVDIHADTVAVTSPDRWQHAPFGAELAGGRIYGRGACDIKGGLAAAVTGLSGLSREEFAGEIMVAVTTAEEMIEGAATRAVLAQGKPDYCVVVEPTGLAVGRAQKGRAGVRLQTRGVSAHTSRADLGVNAVYAMLPAVEAVRRLPALQDDLLGPGVIELVEMISEPFPGNSIVPDGCRVRFDCRLVRGETPGSLLERFRGAAGDGVAVDLWPVTVPLFTGEVLQSQDFHAAWALPSGHPLVETAVRAARQAGLPGELFAAPYCCNASAAAALGIPTIIFGPGDIGRAHAVDEWIGAGEVSDGAKAFAALARTLLA